MNAVWQFGLVLVCVIGMSLATTPCVADNPPQRIVSLNLCIDQILVDLVPASRIAAVTHLATDPAVSATPGKAIGLPVTHGAAEDVLNRNPDLVLAGIYSTPATVSLLRRLGLNVVSVDLPKSYAGVRAVVRQIADAVGERARGDTIIATFDRRLAAAEATQSLRHHKPTALVYQVNNYVSGRDTLVDAALETAGFRNGADALRTDQRGQVALETVLTTPPDVLILSAKPDDYRTVVADNLRHPLLAKAIPAHRMAVIPWSLWLCGTPAIADAVEQLVALRQSLPPLPPHGAP
jgi:iron complex transport system substrate-binding protein